MPERQSSTTWRASITASGATPRSITRALTRSRLTTSLLRCQPKKTVRQNGSRPIQRFAAGQRIRRLTLFENLKRPAESSSSRQLVTNSVQYGLTKGGYTAEYLELTDDGRIASSDESLGKPRLAARFE